uniref:Uncharacterized protein n=1 Tax=Kalanchoe fedtschenkoi TaxID=63787 RepID=A0A7N0RDV7_KALFE
MAFDPTGYGARLPPPPPPHPLYYSAVPYLAAGPTIPNAYPSSHSSCYNPNPPPCYPPPPPPPPSFHAPPPNLAPSGGPARNPCIVIPKDWCPNGKQFHGKCEVLVLPHDAGCHVPSFWCPAFYSLSFKPLGQWREWSDGGSGEDLPDDEYHGNNPWTFKWSWDGGHYANCPLIKVYQNKWLPGGQEFQGQCEVVAPSLEGFIGGPFACPAYFLICLRCWTRNTFPPTGNMFNDDSP